MEDIYTVGSNEEAAKLSGLNVTKIKIFVYGFSGLMCGISGVILLARLNSGQPSTGNMYVLDAIAAAVIGGTSLSGGEGTIVGTIIGALIINVLKNGLNIMHVNQFWQAVKKGTEADAKELGIIITYEGPASEAMLDVQINMIENAIITKADGLLLAALDSEALVPYVQKAVNSGMKVATFDSGVNSDLPVSFVATNNLNAGAIAADELAALVGKKGTVGLIVYDATSQTGQERRDGFMKQMKATYPNIKVLEPVYGGGAHDTSANLITDMVRANPDLVGIFTGNEGSAVGAGIALKELNRKDIALIGFDSGNQQIEFLKEGIIDGFVSQDPFNIGYLGVKTLYNAMMGKAVEKLYDTGAVFVTMDNLNNEEVQRILYH